MVETSPELKLKVAEAIQDDVNKGIVRLDSNFIHQLGLKPGDIVQLEGERQTVAVVDRAYPGDIGLNIIRMDGITRRNAKATIGEYVKLKKVAVKEATKVSIAPSQKGIVIRAPPTIFKQGLLGKAVVKGDIVTLGGARKRRNTMSANPFFNEVFSMMDESVGGGFGLSDLKFIVVDASPSKTPVIIGPNTELNYNPEAVEVREEPVLEVTYEDVGGLSEEVSKIRELVELPLKHPEIFEQLGIEPPKGILLHGPPGTGKTLLAKAVANETNSNFILINGPEIMSKFYGESEANLRKKFEDAEKNAPSIIFIDEIDAIATSREEAKGEVERRVVAQLLTIMDGLKSRGKVVVIAATNMPNALDPALRRPGRFDRELEINPPSKEGRLNILKIHTRGMPLMGTMYPEILKNTYLNELKKRVKESNKEAEKATSEVTLGLESGKINVDDICVLLNALDRNEHIFIGTDVHRRLLDAAKKTPLSSQVAALLAVDPDLSILNKVQSEGVSKDLDEIASNTHGFVGADLAALSKESAMVVLRKVLPDIALDKEEEIPREVLEKLKLRKEDFYEALKVVRPSAMREVLIEVPTTRWEDVGGLESIKQNLKEAVEWPLNHPEVFARMGIRPPKGILLYGPPGTGKTMLAKAVAKESKANFILVNGPELLSKWVGDSEKAVRKIFAKARQTSPSIIFFDEVDSIAPRRGQGGDNDSGVTERVVNQILTELDGLESLANVVVIAATNRPDLLDTALLRPGRFDRIILASVPDDKTRKSIFAIHTKNIPMAKDVDLTVLASKTQGYVGADIEAVCREAAMLALRKDMLVKKVTAADFEEALKVVRPSVSAEIEKMYDNIQESFRMARSKEMQESKVNYFG
ncbi:MAG TPA: CDC48 family AAA ATPase [Acidobacteriota bacterium]|nr:CDC48 family AAA ATPase [Acidobacteriota bacterium]